MTVRASVVTLAGAAALMAIMATAAGARTGAGGWRYVAEYQSLADCQNAGQRLIARRQAREYRCENTYTDKGIAVLDLYAR